MAKVISSTELTSTLTLSLCNDGYWLYDYTRSMNLSMRAKTEQEAFIQALTYYQERLITVETAHKQLSAKVNSFISQFDEEDSEDN